MSGKATDFGLFKQKQERTQNSPIRIIVIISAIVLVIGIPLTIIILTKHVYLAEKPLEINIERPITEKLVTSETRRIDFNPQPFGLTYRGNPPAIFTPTTTQKVTTLNYPQLQSYHPKSIQDIIGYLRKRGPEPMNRGTSNDPFYLYKPQDPSDINLLATASFRFAPPLWSNVKTVPKMYHPQENSNREVVSPMGKPLVITLNIYPTEGDIMNIYKYIQRPFTFKFENPDRFKMKKPNAMVIHLNVFPEQGVQTKERVFRGVPAEKK